MKLEVTVWFVLLMTKVYQQLGINENWLEEMKGYLKILIQQQQYLVLNLKKKLNSKKYNANRLCSKLKIKNNSKTYKDWFLPSKENLALMYLNRSVINETALKNGGSNFIDSYYWSSTEFDHTNAWVQSFKDGKKGYHFKNYFYSVRAIRAF